MSLAYLAVALAGIGVLVGLNWLLLPSRAPGLDAAAVQALLARDDPGLRLQQLAAGTDAGIADAGEGGLYAVAALGDRLVGRRIEPGYLLAAEAQRGTLRLRFDDPAFPRLRVCFADPAEAEIWATRLASILRNAA